MDYTEETLMRLRNSLPWCYGEILQERILEKTGKRLIPNSIRRHLTVKYANTETITEAMLLAEEYRKERQLKAYTLAKRK
jgi:hypothetical protein